MHLVSFDMEDGCNRIKTCIQDWGILIPIISVPRLVETDSHCTIRSDLHTKNHRKYREERVEGHQTASLAI